ncbi:hypothetical protein VTK73DRAFT_6177 [Phialemonium thermophilum]|uniref:chitin deacetylase n=1 Tax=Phialemonium thermophilum TaxID=223376 RepID=A0ABR3WK95_9PEZI
MLSLPRLFLVPPKLRRRARRRRMAMLLVLLALFVLLIAPFYIIYKPPSFLIRYFRYRWPDVLWEVQLPSGADTSAKVVALTIDDAPSPYTRDILRLLEDNEAHATFFVIGGQVSGREEMLREMVLAGHELGNHAMHDEPAKALPNDVLEEQIVAVQDMIEKAYIVEGKLDGQDSPSQRNKYFRPGSGFFSDAMRSLLRRMGYRLVLGSVYPHDAQISSPWLNARHVLSMVRPGAIIICHDRRSWTVPMLETVLPTLKRRGYRVVTVSELLHEAEGT